MTEAEIEKKVERVKATFALEGMYLTEEELENGRAILSGRKTVDELVAKAIQRHKQNGGE